MDYNNYDPSNNSQPPMQTPGQHPKKGMCVASMVLGIVSLAFFCIWWISIPCGIIALALGLTANKAGKNSMATAGLVMGIIGLAVSALVTILAIAGLASLSESFKDLR